MATPLFDHSPDGVAQAHRALATGIVVRLRHGPKLALPAAVRSHTPATLRQENLRDARNLAIVNVVFLTVAFGFGAIANWPDLRDSLSWLIPGALGLVAIEAVVFALLAVRSARRYRDPKITGALDLDGLKCTVMGKPSVTGRWQELTLKGLTWRSAKGSVTVTGIEIADPRGQSLMVSPDLFPDAQKLMNTLLQRLHAAGRLNLLDRKSQPIDLPRG